MSEEIKEKFYGGEAAAREAFEELCAMVDQINVSFGSAWTRGGHQNF